MKERTSVYLLHVWTACVGLLVVCAAAMSHAKAVNVRDIDSLNAKGERALNTDLGVALQLARAAEQASRTVGYVQGLAAATATRSIVWANTNKCNEALVTIVETMHSMKDASALATLYSAAGICWYYYGNYDSAKLYCEKALQFYDHNSMPVKYASTVLLLGKVHIKTGNQQKALASYRQATSVSADKTTEAQKARAADLLGEIYYVQHLYDKAMTCFDESYQSFKKQGDRAGLGSVLLHRGNIFYMQAKDDSALVCYRAALENFTVLGDSNGMAIAYSNISRTLLEKGNIDEAISYAEKALNIIRPGNYTSLEAGTYQLLGDIYGEQKDYHKAIACVEKALAAARSNDNKVIARNCYKSLSELYEVMGKYAPAMKNLLAAYRLNDSIQPIIFATQLAEMEAKYKTDKKQAEILLLQQREQINKLQLQQQEHRLKKQGYLLLVSGMLLIAIVLAAYYYNSRRQLREQINRRDAIRATEEKERGRIAKDIHDELGSGLSKIRFLSELAVGQTGSQAQGSLHSISDTSRGLVENMRDLVWAMNPENTTLDNLVARIREYSHDYLEEFPIEVVFDFPDDVPNYKISREVSRNVHMIVKETLQNIIKHAAATKVFIKISLVPFFRLQMSDNGKGYEQATITEGNGLKNISARAEALGAVLHITSAPGKGSELILEFAEGAGDE